MHMYSMSQLKRKFNSVQFLPMKHCTEYSA